MNTYVRVHCNQISADILKSFDARAAEIQHSEVFEVALHSIMESGVDLERVICQVSDDEKHAGFIFIAADREEFRHPALIVRTSWNAFHSLCVSPSWYDSNEDRIYILADWTKPKRVDDYREEMKGFWKHVQHQFDINEERIQALKDDKINRRDFAEFVLDCCVGGAIGSQTTIPIMQAFDGDKGARSNGFAAFMALLRNLPCYTFEGLAERTTEIHKGFDKLVGFKPELVKAAQLKLVM
jgi:hypothetical protein